MIPTVATKIFRAEFFRFACVGTVGFAVDYLVVLVCVQVVLLSPYLSRVFSFLAAMLTTYALNRAFTFSARVKKPGCTPGLPAYACAMLLGLCCNFLLYTAMLHLFAFADIEMRLLLAVAAGSLGGLAVNFFLCSKVLFRAR